MESTSDQHDPCGFEIFSANVLNTEIIDKVVNDIVDEMEAYTSL